MNTLRLPALVALAAFEAALEHVRLDFSELEPVIAGSLETLCRPAGVFFRETETRDD